MLKKLSFLLTAILLIAIVISSCKKKEDDPLRAPGINDPLHVYADYFYVNWIGVVGAQGYVVDVATDQSFINILPDYNNLEVEINGMFIVEGLTSNTAYYVRMRSYNSNETTGNSAVKQFQTLASNVLPNMDMEEWITTPNYENPFPHGVWASANKVADLNPAIYPVLLFKTEDAYSGNYAAKMVTNEAIGMPLLAGSLSTGLFSVNLEDPLKSLIRGVPYKSRPIRFLGYYKYAGAGGDSCEIRTTLSKWNVTEHKREIIGEAIYRTTDTIEEYTPFDLEVIYFSSDIVDTIEMVFAASAGGENFQGKVGSTLYVDDFSLIFE
ncbi:MAG: PCMD domain-containing protein [Bacteroidetes bacterium]|nr:PCMD domain-containing protein [Bacteroidota bacterium]